MTDLLRSPLFPVEGLSKETVIKLPSQPTAESGSVKLYLIQAEQNLFLEGFSEEETKDRPPTILRGCLFVRILRPVKIKSISLKLTAVARTDWPEGIPPKRVEHVEQNTLMQHTWPFFHHTNTYENTETSRSNADIFIPKNDLDCEPSNFSLDNSISPVTSAIDSLSEMMPVRSPSPLAMVLKGKRSSSPRPNLFAQISQQDGQDLTPIKSTNSIDDTKLFVPGDYIYSFEHPIPASSPESIQVTFGSVHYNLEAYLERSGTFKSSLTAKKTVNIVRTPSQDSSEENEPIVINRDWEDQLNYEIVVSSKQVLLNSYLPIIFKLSPLDKIKIHRIKIYFTEHLEYYCKSKHVHRTEPPRKYLLLEHKATNDEENLLSVDGDEISAKELDFHVYVPERLGDRYRLHPDTYYDDIQSHHWIKICIRISRSAPTAEDPKKRKHFELSIDSPIHILSPLCAHANTLLPSYEAQMAESPQLGRQSIDLLLSPRSRVNTESNLYQPDDRTPSELKSPQAKPFSPLSSPEMTPLGLDLRNTGSFGLIPQMLRNSSYNSSGLGYEEPPPNFEETARDVPPTYDQAVKEKSRTSRENNDESVKITEPVREERRSRLDRETERQDQEESDLGGNFKLEIIPIRSRSTSRSADGVRSRSPPLDPQFRAKSKLISSSLIPGHFLGNSNSSQGMDDTLTQAFENENTIPESPSKPMNIPIASSQMPGNELETNFLEPTSSTIDSNMNSPSRYSTRSSINSFTGSLISEDPATRKPLLSKEITNIYSGENPSALFKSAPDNGSSVDITAMLGSSVSNNFDYGSATDASWHPFDLTSTFGNVSQPHITHNNRTVRRMGPPKISSRNGDYSGTDYQDHNTDYRNAGRHLSFGVEPVLSVLAATGLHDEVSTNEKHAGSQSVRNSESAIEE
ncbi:hypothetical protein OGAPHI_007032 [Ogataea philodendri]|uniref:Arrestin C-terminal-like domain-containing protein n=1 Tax=Ogataea philodendri TaxID=1378263 RepID=A0A9P8NWD7_9ASCO|nr:uncharacterized protein OGAPHI_007032 [Ogataea philodendri]KAH3660446.1 hypothetical protein OGAPHI_007032 [Ogataea philodendri]